MAARLWNHRCNHQCCVFCRPYLWSFICQGWFAALEHVQIAKSADGGHSGFKQQLFPAPFDRGGTGVQLCDSISDGQNQSTFSHRDDAASA